MGTQYTEQILEVFGGLGLGAIKSISPINKGVVNPCFEVNGRWIVRLNLRDQNIPKFSRENQAYKRCRSRGVPVPGEVYYTKTSEGVEILVVSKASGQQLAEVWKNLSEKEKSKVTISAGVCLAKVHEIEFKKFGGLAPEDPKFDQWKDYLIYRTKYHFNECLADGLLPVDDLDALLQIIESRGALLSEVKNPRLIHGDFHFGNILVDQGQVSAILDWEWSLAGDLIFEFLNRSNINGECAGGFELITDSYEIQWPLSSEVFERYLVYQLVSAVEMIWVSNRFFSKQYSWGKEEFEKKAQEYQKLKERLL